MVGAAQPGLIPWGDPMRLAWLTLFAALGCSAGPATVHDAAVSDVGADARPLEDRADVSAPQRVPLGGGCSTDAPCDDGVFCNGVERCEQGRCVAGADPCDDNVRCTVDRCDEGARRCAHTPDGARCGDGDRCNGDERCAPADPTADRATGCTRPAQGVDCNDHDPCTVDACAPTQGCVHAPRDLDGDGHVDRLCPRDARPGSAPGDDCDDRDPAVHPMVTERCGDGRDNNCDGLVDLADAVACRPANSSCAGAVALMSAGNELVGYGSTAAFAPGAPLPCVDAMVTRGTAWFRMSLPSPRDVVLRVDDGAREGEVPGAVALFRACGEVTAPPCDSGTRGGDAGAGADPELRANNVAAGEWFVAVQTAGARPFSLRVTLSPVSDGGT